MPIRTIPEEPGRTAADEGVMADLTAKSRHDAGYSALKRWLAGRDRVLCYGIAPTAIAIAVWPKYSSAVEFP